RRPIMSVVTWWLTERDNQEPREMRRELIGLRKSIPARGGLKYRKNPVSGYGTRRSTARLLHRVNDPEAAVLLQQSCPLVLAEKPVGKRKVSEWNLGEFGPRAGNPEADVRIRGEQAAQLRLGVEARNRRAGT